MISLPESHLSRNPHRTSRWTVFLSAVASLLFLPAIGFAQESASKRATLPGGDVEAARERAHATIRALSPSCTTGTASFGHTISGQLDVSDCSSTVSSGTLYADFYAF